MFTFYLLLTYLNSASSPTVDIVTSQMQRDKGYPIAREPPRPPPRAQFKEASAIDGSCPFDNRIYSKDSLPGILLQKVLASQDAKVQLL